MQPIKIYIADDYYLIREGIKKSIKDYKEIILIGESNDLKTSLPEIVSLKPTILIIEINLCKSSINEVLRELRTKAPSTKILVMSDCTCKEPVIDALRGGISGFIKKNVTQKTLLEAIFSISTGKDYYTSEITAIITQSYKEETLSNNPLSNRELEILQAICLGLTNDEIAAKLFLSSSTVITHKRNMMKKANIKKTSDLILWALKNNLVPSIK